MLKVQQSLDAKRRVRYRIYRHTEPITPANILAAERLAEIEPLSGWNIDGRSPDQAFMIMRKRMLTDLDYAKEVSRNSYAIPQSAHEAVVIDRFVIPGGEPKPVANGTGLYVHQPAKAGKAFYAATAVVNGRENVAGVKGIGPVEEWTGPGRPVFQGDMDMKILFDYPGHRLQYVQWTSPPLSNRPNQYHNWGMFIPNAFNRPGPMEVHLSGSDMWRRPRWPHRLDTIMISPADDEFGQGFYYGYPESAGTLKGLKSGAIQPYTWRRMLAFVDWVVKHNLSLPSPPLSRIADPSCVSLSGDRGHSSTGALHLAMRHPEVFSLVYTCKGMPNPAALPLTRKSYGRTYPTGTGDLQKLFGKIEWALKTDTGQNVWEFFDLPPEVAAHPEVLRPMLSYGGRGGWDFKPVAALLQALAETRQPVVSEGNWGSVGPPMIKNPGRGWGGLTVRRDRPIPIFTKCSSDYQGGRNGDGGATNYIVSWLDESIVDTPQRFEIVITGHCVVDVTPRRMKKFLITPGEKLRYERVPIDGRREDKPGSGHVLADKNGLVTVPQVGVRDKTRLILTRSGS